MQRGEKLEDLLDTTNAIALEASLFEERATHLHRALWWKNVKLWLALGCIILARYDLLQSFSTILF